MESGIQVLGKATPDSAEVLPEALAFVADLAREFEPERRILIQARSQRQTQLDAGQMPDCLVQAREPDRIGSWTAWLSSLPSSNSSPFQDTVTWSRPLSYCKEIL